MKVLDFGLAKAIEGEAVHLDVSQSPTITTPAATRLGVILGTAAYMSPEQARGRAVDRRADVWAFGCVLYEMLTGTRAFGGDDITDTIAAVVRAEPDWHALPVATPPAVRTLLRRCLEKDARKRWQAAGDLRVEIEAVLAAPGADSHASPSLAAARLSAWRVAALVLVAGIVGSAVTAALMWAPRLPAPTATVSRFSVALPAGVTFTSTGRPLVAVSPDGSSVAFVANNQLYLRRMADLEPRAIPGTSLGAGVTTPFFSPDGQWIGFWTARDNTLKKIGIGGGAPVTLAETANPFGASWDGDTVVFGKAGEGILAVPATGGTAETWVTTAPDEQADSPQVLPGGNAVMFTVTRASGLARWDSADIAVFVRGTGERKVLVHGGAAGRYLPTGHIVYAVGANLMAVPFDVQRLEVTGGPVPVMEGVTRAANAGINTGGANFAVSSNGTLVFVPGAGDAVDMRTLVWIDRAGREEAVKTQARAFLYPQVSPSARQLAIEIKSDSDDIWTFDLARGVLTRQTFEADEDETPVWSPDGVWVAYTSTRGKDRIVFRRRADGSGPEERLWSLPMPAHIHVEDWSRDGHLVLAVTADFGSQQYDVMVLPVDGDRAPRLLLRTRFNEQAGRVSPDGRWIAYSSNESGRGEVYVQAFPSLEGKWQISTGGGTQPVWSRRGDELFYRGDGAMMAVSLPPGASFSPGAPRKVFDDRFFGPEGSRANYDVSPDGRRFLMIKDGGSDGQTAGSQQIIVVQNWTSELTRLVPAN